MSAPFLFTSHKRERQSVTRRVKNNVQLYRKGTQTLFSLFPYGWTLQLPVTLTMISRRAIALLCQEFRGGNAPRDAMGMKSRRTVRGTTGAKLHARFRAYLIRRSVSSNSERVRARSDLSPAE